MTASNYSYKDHCIATTAAFDEIDTPVAGATPTKKDDSTTHLTSAAYGKQLTKPVTPCPTDESLASTAASTTISITGKLRNIEDKYEIDHRILGTGHTGSVRECIHRMTGQRYAVKSIRKVDRSFKPNGVEREIKLLKQMKHPSIIQLVDVYEDHVYIHLVTDLCKGGELFDKIVEKVSNSNTSNGDDTDDPPCFSEREAARTIHQILTAVSYIHKRGIVHRDLKPENILFESQNNEVSSIKLIDFGLARRHLSSRGEAPMSTIVGTPYYIAPEVLDHNYDKACDLWSIGVITYILLCGYPPFNGRTADEVHYNVQRGKYRFPSEDWSNVSTEARRFIRRFLQRDPRKRMTVEQALNHPWMKKYVNTNNYASEEGRQDNSSVGVVFKGSSKREAFRDKLKIPLLLFS